MIYFTTSPFPARAPQLALLAQHSAKNVGLLCLHVPKAQLWQVEGEALQV